MSTPLISPAQGTFTGLTFGVGIFDWLTANAAAITPAAVILTTVAAVIFGFWNARTNSERNRINKRNIIENLLVDLELDQDKTYSASEIKCMIRKQ